MNRKVFIVTEREDFLIGTVGQVLDGRALCGSLKQMLQDVLREMIDEECFDDDSISFTIEIR